METKKAYYDKKARTVNYQSGDKLLQYYQCCLLKNVNYMTKDLAPHRDKESACIFPKGQDDKKKNGGGETGAVDLSL